MSRKTKFSLTSSPASMPSGVPPTSWACGFCNEPHPIYNIGQPHAYCPKMGKVYSEAALKLYRKTSPKWWEQHKFIQTDQGVLCEECGKSYEDLEAAEQLRWAE